MCILPIIVCISCIERDIGGGFVGLVKGSGLLESLFL